MAKIQGKIQPSNYEIIRDQIGAILASEIANQAYQYHDPDLNLTVWRERFIPFGNEEVPAINVGIMGGQYTRQFIHQRQGLYQYAIDVYGKGMFNEDGGKIDVDKASMYRTQKIMAICMNILMAPDYVRLGLDPPSISNRHVESFNVGSDEKTTQGMTVGRIVFQVEVPEEVILKGTYHMVQSDTTVKLDLTDKGYHYTTLIY